MSDDYHLKQEQLAGAKALDALERFGRWLQEDTTSFEENKEEHFEHCTDSRLADKGAKLLKDLGISNKIRFRRFGFVVLRVPGPSPAKFQVTTGHAIMIPIRVTSGNPTVSEKELIPGFATYITEPIEVNPSLDCLFVVEAEA